MVTYEEIIARIGSFGCYQKLCLVWCFSIVVVTTTQNGFMIFGSIPPISECKLNESNCTSSEHSRFYSVAQQWNLTGSQRYLIAVITSVQMIGGFFGPLISGQISDKFGRRSAFLLFFVGFLSSSILAAFSDQWQLFLVARFLIGLSCGGTHSTAAVLYSEIVSQKWRLIIHTITWPSGYICLGILAIITSHWRRLTIAIIIACSPVILISLAILESPKWLIEMGQLMRAEKILKRIASINRINRRSTVDEEIEQFIKNGAQTSSQKKRKYPFWYLFYSQQSTLSMLSISYGHFSCFLAQYVQLFLMDKFTGNPALNLIYIYLVCLFTAGVLPQLLELKFKKLGRRPALFFTLFLSIICLTMTVVYYWTVEADRKPYSYIPIGLALISLNCTILTNALFSVLKIELFPTVLRNSASTTCLAVGRFGAVVAPPVVLLFKIWKPLPYLIILFSLLLNLLMQYFFVPETKGTVLPDLPEHLKHRFERPAKAVTFLHDI